MVSGIVWSDFALKLSGIIPINLLERIGFFAPFL
jgi:hypothetical protein